MSCNPGDSCFQTPLLGRTIDGRSSAGYDYRATNQYGLQHAGTSNTITNGIYGVQTRGGVMRQYGVPKTEEERMLTHIANYGNSELPIRGTGLARMENEFPWGTFIAGGMLGLLFGYFVFASSGREIGYATGQRVARKVRG